MVGKECKRDREEPWWYFKTNDDRWWLQSQSLLTRCCSTCTSFFVVVADVDNWFTCAIICISHTKTTNIPIKKFGWGKQVAKRTSFVPLCMWGNVRKPRVYFIYSAPVYTKANTKYAILCCANIISYQWLILSASLRRCASSERGFKNFCFAVSLMYVLTKRCNRFL